MKIGIHHRKGSYSDGWIDYCEKRRIPYKVVNAYNSEIIKDLGDCDIFMWHHIQSDPKDVLFAKQLLFSLEQAGKIVYPDWQTNWHFDDKMGQKYLLEALNLPLIPTYIFYDKNEALNWASNHEFPVVFKLRCGAGSYNVSLVKSKKDAFKIINKAFRKGFRLNNPLFDLKDNLRKYLKSESGIKDLIKSAAHLIYPYKIEKVKGRERGYTYFQDFIRDCTCDIRIQLVGKKCYAMIRKVRDNDFRASGSGDIDFDGSKITPSLIKASFGILNLLKAQSLAIDWVSHKDNFLISEISYAWGIAKGELDYGYWDDSLNWHYGKINPFEWIIENVIEKFKGTCRSV